jgi:NADPH-dependent ferric siderophore reductase
MATTRIRRDPPAFRRAEVLRATSLTPRLRRVTLAGPELVGMPAAGPAASVRLVLPPVDHDEVVLPGWTGNLFLNADGTRPHIRTLTPMRIDGTAGEVDVDIVVHDGGGRMSDWGAAVGPGAQAGLAGPGREQVLDPSAPHHVLAGDESALPAIVTLLRSTPPTTEVRVLVEVGAPEGRLELPDHPRTTVTWIDQPAGATPGHALADAVIALDHPEGTRLFAAGEAAAVQRIRRHLFEVLGWPRPHATVRGYWKHGRAGDADDTD